MARTNEITPLTDKQRELVETHADLPRRISVRFINRCFAMGVDIQDVISAGYLGLISSAQHYDPTKAINPNFEAYAFKNIIGTMKNYFRDYGRVIRVPRPVQDEFAKRGPDFTESLPMSLNKIITDDGSEHNRNALQAFIMGESLDDSRIVVKEFIDTLPMQHMEILKLRLRGLTQQEIADQLKTSQMNVSRILRRIGEKYKQM